MGSLRLVATFSASIFLIAGCAANDVMVKRQTETEARVEHLFQLAGSTEARFNDLASRLASLEEKEPSRTSSIQELQESVKELKESNRLLKLKIAELSVTSTPKVEIVNPVSPSSKGKDAGPPASYVKAFGLYSTNNFTGAISAFEHFLKENPTGEYAPNAYYWIAECYYSTNDLAKALVAFQKVVDSWPQHPKASDSLLKIGYSYRALQQPEKAKSAFERIIRSYPGSPASQKARERLMSRENTAS